MAEPAFTIVVHGFQAPPRQPGRQLLAVCTGTEYLLKAGEVDLPVFAVGVKSLDLGQDRSSWYSLLPMQIWHLHEGSRGLDTVPGEVCQQLCCVRQLHVAELLSNLPSPWAWDRIRVGAWLVPISLRCRVRLDAEDDERTEAVSAGFYFHKLRGTEGSLRCRGLILNSSDRGRDSWVQTYEHCTPKPTFVLNGRFRKE